MTNDMWDYVIVGAGSAGCVVASRLSEDPDVRVLLIEAGPDPKNFWIGVPAGMAKLMSSDRFNWSYVSEPEARLNGRRIPWPRGRALGGSSAINGMAYTRGNRRDYDHWASLGNPGWAWSDVLPYFKSMEDNEKGANAYRGTGGPLKVGGQGLRSQVISDFVEAATQCGIRRIDDISVAGEEGVGLLQATIHKGVRRSSYDAFVAPVLSRKNLTVMTGVLAMRVMMDGRAATGVEILQSGQKRTVRAAREVILSAGVLSSPHLLMLSGLGDGETLRRYGIPTIAHIPGVGKNLQDHYSVHMKFRTEAGRSHNASLHGWRKYREGLRYLLGKKGYLSVGSTLAAAFTRSSASVEYADLEIGFRPITFSYHSSGEVTVDDFDAISANVYRVRPASRGEILLRSADAEQAPAIHPNYLSASEDLDATLAGLRQIREIFAAQPLACSILGELMPGPEARTEQQLADYIVTRGKSSYHPVGTCKMGKDAMAVVDARLRVQGIRGLRVIDASIMPTLTSGNTNAPAMMIGERGAAFIREEGSTGRHEA